MKNDMNHQIKQARENLTKKAIVIDVILSPHNQTMQPQPPKRRRRVNYAKKIMNDPFIMNV